MSFFSHLDCLQREKSLPGAALREKAAEGAQRKVLSGVRPPPRGQQSHEVVGITPLSLRGEGLPQRQV